MAIQDITERKRAEEEVRASEQRFKAAFMTGLDGVYIATLEDGRAIEVNDEFAELFGYAREELIGRTSPELNLYCDPADRATMVSGLMARGRIKDFEVKGRKKNGQVMTGSLSASVMHAGGVPYVLGVIRDITERKRVEEKLRESALQLLEAADLAKIVYWEYDEETGEFIFNDAFYDLYRTTAEQEGGYRMAKWEYGKRFVHPDDRDELKVRAETRDTRPGAFGLEQYEHKGIRRDGDIMHVLVRHRSITDEDGHVLKTIGMNQDITERRKMEDALRGSETTLRAILDASRDAMGVSREGIRIFVNPAYVSLFGYESDEELMGTPIINVIAPESRDFIEERVKKRARGEPLQPSFEATGLRKDGTIFLMEVTVSTYVLNGQRFLLIVMRDITDRKKAEDELKLLKHSIDVHYDGAYWMDTDNRLVYVNSAACKALGYERDELIGKTVYDVNPDMTPERVKKFWEGFREGGSVIGEAVQRRKDGTEFPVEITTTYVRFGGHEFACGFARDISEKRKLEAQLRQAQKMEAIGTLAGGVAHDFNNILTVIMGLGNLIQMSLNPDDRNKPYIDQIVLSSERAADLTQSLLAFSRKQRITLEPHKVNAVVADTAKLLKRLLTEDITLKVDLTDDHAIAMLDVSQVDQVLMNLATNARDAMPNGGLLTIKTDVATLDETFKKIHGFGRPGTYAQLSVSDTGIGMDEKTMARIFDPFFTTKEIGKGTGLGLASVYGIVKQHEGYITVRSGLLEGTTFDTYLPLVDETVQQPAAASPSLQNGSETILVLEDDRDVRNMMAKIFSDQGYTTLEAANGYDAIRVFEEHKEKIRLVILDVVMPGKNGREVFDEITRIDPQVKAIFMSGYTGDIVVDKGVEKDSVDFLQKPLSVAKLLAKVREVLDR
jgi:two-component system NtrC family sensor kinase